MACFQTCPQAEGPQLHHAKQAALHQEFQPRRAVGDTSVSSPALKISELQLQRALLSATRAVRKWERR